MFATISYETKWKKVASVSSTCVWKTIQAISAPRMLNSRSTTDMPTIYWMVLSIAGTGRMSNPNPLLTAIIVEYNYLVLQMWRKQVPRMWRNQRGFYIGVPASDTRGIFWYTVQHAFAYKKSIMRLAAPPARIKGAIAITREQGVTNKDWTTRCTTYAHTYATSKSTCQDNNKGKEQRYKKARYKKPIFSLELN